MDKMMIAVKTYDKIAEAYAEEYFDDRIDLRYLDKFLLLLGKDAKILDVGCGPGNNTKYIMEKGFKVEGIDLSAEMLKVAKRMVPEGKFKKMDMRKLKYSDQSFDGLCAAYSLHHIEARHVPKTLKEFYRVLKPGGLIVLKLQEGMGEVIINEPFNPKEKMFFKFFTKSEISNLLKEIGFKVIYLTERKSRDKLELKNDKLFVIARKI